MRFLRQIAIGILAAFLSSGLLFGDKINIPPASFHPPNNVDYRTLGNDGEYVYGSVYLYAPVHLPDGVILKNMKAMVVDGSNLGWIDVYLYRVNMYTKAQESIFGVGTWAYTSSSDIHALVDSTVSPANRRLVNNGVCQYYIMFIGGDSTLRLHGVAIEYQ